MLEGNGGCFGVGAYLLDLLHPLPSQSPPSASSANHESKCFQYFLRRNSLELLTSHLLTKINLAFTN